MGRRTTRIVVNLRQKWPQRGNNSRKAPGRMAASRGGGLSATTLNEDLGTVFGENNEG
jgi:hypothetical protein